MHCPPSVVVIEAHTWVFFGCTLTVKLALINFVRKLFGVGNFQTSLHCGALVAAENDREALWILIKPLNNTDWCDVTCNVTVHH